MTPNTTDTSYEIANRSLELLVGASAIATALGLTARRIYEMSDKKELPGLIKIGSSIAIRRKRLAEWLETLEAEGTA